MNPLGIYSSVDILPLLPQAPKKIFMLLQLKNEKMIQKKFWLLFLLLTEGSSLFAQSDDTPFQPSGKTIIQIFGNFDYSYRR